MAENTKNVTKAVQRACDLLIRLVRFDTDRKDVDGSSLMAGLYLPEGYKAKGFPEGDTLAIREATRIYVETWIVPILEAIRTGDTRLLQELRRE